MTIRSILTSNVPTAAVGGISLALLAASLACAFAACYGVADPRLTSAPAAQATTALVRLAPTDAAAAPPLAHFAEPVRCAGGPAGRARRGHSGLCRIVDMPPV